ncbi:MAG: AAA family ATPase [Chloroflexi bacterium]|nr:AAA family ATPase [Chloroflexota bacterium]
MSTKAEIKRDDKNLGSYIFWLATHHEDFIKKYVDRIHPETWESDEQAWLLEETVKYFKKHHKLIPEEVLLILLAAKKVSPRFDKETVVELYKKGGPREEVIPWVMDDAAEYFKRRDIREVLSEAVETVSSGSPDDVVQALNKGVRELNRTPDDGRRFELRVNQDLGPIWEEIGREYIVDERAASTGIPDVDSILGGGLRPGELGVVLAPPGRGKSHWLIHCARTAWWKNRNVAFYSFEMSEGRVFARFLAGATGIGANEIDSQRARADKRLTQKARKAGVDAGFFVRRFGDNEATVSDIYNDIASLQDEGNDIGLVVIDYGDIIRPEVRSARGRVDDQAEIYKALRGMAVSLDVPVWTASQANRDSLRKSSFGLENVADSFDKVKIADYVIALCQDGTEKTAGRMRLAFAKSRNNGQGEEILVYAELDKAFFREHDGV